LYWPITAGIGIIPADTKNKKIYLMDGPKLTFEILILQQSSIMVVTIEA
jgi:hypothetical protein